MGVSSLGLEDRYQSGGRAVKKIPFQFKVIGSLGSFRKSRKYPFSAKWLSPWEVFRNLIFLVCFFAMTDNWQFNICGLIFWLHLLKKPSNRTMKKWKFEKKNEENKFLEVERCCEGISQRLARQDHYLLFGSQTWDAISLEHFCWKKMLSFCLPIFRSPKLGHNSEFWFYHHKCHFLCGHI